MIQARTKRVEKTSSVPDQTLSSLCFIMVMQETAPLLLQNAKLSHSFNLLFTSTFLITEVLVQLLYVRRVLKTKRVFKYSMNA